MKFEIIDSSYWVDGNQLLKKYPNLSTIGEYYISENEELIIVSNDFSIAQKILATVHGKIIIETRGKCDYRIIIYDGYVE